MKRRVLAILLAVAMISALVAIPALATATTTTVPSGGDIQAAIDAAASGDTIELASGGTYELEVSLIIDKSLTIVGNGATISPAADFTGNGTASIGGYTSGANPIIFAETGDITLENLTVEGPFPESTGASRYNGVTSTADNLTMNQVTITAIKSVNPAWNGVQTGSALYVNPSNTSNATLTDCTLSDFMKGGINFFGHNLTVTGTTITGIGQTDVIGQYGIYYYPDYPSVAGGGTSTGIGTFTDNTISSLSYVAGGADDYSAVGIGTNGLTVANGNTITGADNAVQVISTNAIALFTNTTINGVAGTGLNGFSTQDGAKLFYDANTFSSDINPQYQNLDDPSAHPTETTSDGTNNFPISITISPETEAMTTGQTLPLPADTVVMDSAVTDLWTPVSYQSDSAHVKVNSDGTMTAVSPGTANITAMFSLTTASGIQLVSNVCVVTVTATPIPAMYTVTFDANGGTVSPTSVTQASEGASVTLPTPKRSGYTFDGWYTSTGAKVTSPYTPTSDVTLTAKWTPIPPIVEPVLFTITFDSQGGSVVAPQTVTEGGLIVKPYTPTRKGYTFAGWYTDKACTKAWDFTIDMPTADMTLYAKWTPVKATTIPPAATPLIATGDATAIPAISVLALLIGASVVFALQKRREQAEL